MKNINTILKSIQKTIKTSKIVKVMLLSFNKLAQLANLKPKQLVILLGLLLVCLATLVLGMLRGNKEGYTTMLEAETDRIKIVDAMNCAINNSTTVESTQTTMRSNINEWYTKYINYLMQGDDFNIKNNMDIRGNNNRKIHKIKNTADISGTTRPKYIDETDIASIASGDLTKYELVYVYEKGSVDTNNYTITGDNKIYKIRDETSVSATMPKYIDNIPALPATTTNGTPSLLTYSLIDIKVPMGKLAVDSAENTIITTDFNVNTISKVKLIEAFYNLKKYAEDYVALMPSSTSNGIEGFTTADVNLILNQGTRFTVTERDTPTTVIKRNVDPCNVAAGAGAAGASGSSSLNCIGNWTNVGNCVNGSIKKKYSVTRAASNGGIPCGYAHDEVRNFSCVSNSVAGDDTDDDDDTTVPASITNPDLLRQYLSKIDTDFANANKWKQLYITELKRRNDYIKYANLHNSTYHNPSKTQQQQQQQQASRTTQGYASLTGTGTGNASGSVPPGDEDLYMLKSRMVPPTNPPGSGMNNHQDQESQKECSSSNGCSKPAPVPPCPPCERCPEPAFDCKRVPNYNSVTSSQYLPRPVLTDFSQFGM